MYTYLLFRDSGMPCWKCPGVGAPLAVSDTLCDRWMECTLCCRRDLPVCGKHTINFCDRSYHALSAAVQQSFLYCTLKDSDESESSGFESESKSKSLVSESGSLQKDSSPSP